MLEKIKKSIEYNKILKVFLGALIVVLILEVTLFNFRFYESRGYKEISTSDYIYGGGIKKTSLGTLKVVDNNNNYVEIKNINKHLNNIYLKFIDDNKVSKNINVSIGYTDDANKYYSYTEDRNFHTSRGEILKLHLNGITPKIRLYINTIDEGADTFNIEKISFNKKVPFKFSIVRIFLLVLLIMIIYIFRPSSSLYKMDISGRKAKKIIKIVIVGQIIILGIVLQFNRYFVSESFTKFQRFQYQLLAEAFTKGQTYLDIEPSPILKGLKNPYDMKARNKAFSNTREDYIWDAAFYNNRYYVYFGVAPVILFYLPFYVITGHHIKTSTCIFITGIFTVIGIFLLLYQVIKKWFRNVKLGHYIVIALLFINACGILAIAGRPDHYSLPILLAITFSVYGLYFWLKAVDDKLRAKYLGLGSLCMAMVAACRPQILLTSFLAIPIFWDKVFKERKLFSKDSIKKTVCFVAPYVVIALLLMIYNFVRFSSPFDFGANYNLTTNDMTRRGFIFGRTFLGIYYYLFRPFNILIKFPFIMRDPVHTNYMGTTIYEDMSGGFMFANLLCLLALFIFKFKNEFKDKMPYKLGCFMVVFTFIIIFADTQMAGILPRYVCDFGFLLYLTTSFVLFNKLSKSKNNTRLTKIIYICFIFGLVYNFLLLFSDTDIYFSPLFYYFRSILEFWV